MRPFSLHPIAHWRRQHPPRPRRQSSSVLQECADELALIVERRRSLLGD